MKVGVVYPQTQLGGDPEAVRRIGLATESLGYDHLLAYDHVLGAVHEGRDPKLWGPYTERDPFHDPFVMFGYLAGLTSRIELATGVLILPQRQTALVAQQAADVELLSGGRLRLGVGTGWNYVEYDSLGTDFATRGPRMDEQIEVLRRLWTEELVTFEGRFHTIDRACILPRPRTQIPVWIGGFSEPAFKRGARVGDGFIFAGDTERCLEGLERVRTLLQEAGRDPSTFGTDLVALRARTPEESVETVERWREAGGTHASVVTMGMRLDGLDAHLDAIAAVASKLGLPGA